MDSKQLKRTKASVILLGIIMTLMGLAFFVNPADAMEFVTLCCGWILIFGGAGTFVGHFRNEATERSWWDVFFAVIEVILGVLFLVQTGWASLYLIVFLACMVVVSGVADIMDAFALRQVPGSGWVLWLILGILTVFFGCLMFASPVLMAEAVMLICGFSLLFNGITEIVIGVRI